MAEIKTPDDLHLPDWFDIDRYEFEPMGEDERKQAAMAVIDRLQFYQIATAPGFDPQSIGEDEREEALAALEEWSAYPYRRSTSQWRGALRAALCPAITAGDVAVFVGILERECLEPLDDAKDDAADWQALEDIVKGVQPMTAEEKLLEIQKLLESREVKGWMAPIEPHWAGKLLTYYAGAYMDLAIWAALAGHTINVRSLHSNFRIDSRHRRIRASVRSNEVSVRDFMEMLKTVRTAGLLARLKGDN